MSRLCSLLSILILAMLLAGCAPRAAVQPVEAKALENPTATALPEPSATVPHHPPASCPITVPQDPPFTAPPPYSPNSPFDLNFWYGSSALWTDLPKDGIWYALPHHPEGYTQKVFLDRAASGARSPGAPTAPRRRPAFAPCRCRASARPRRCGR